MLPDFPEFGCQCVKSESRGEGIDFLIDFILFILFISILEASPDSSQDHSGIFGNQVKKALKFFHRSCGFAADFFHH